MPITLAGVYPAVVEWTDVKEPEGAAPYILIAAIVNDNGTDEMQYFRCYTSDKALFFSNRQLLKIGFDIKTRSIYTLANRSTLLHGAKFDALAQEETYQGKTRLKWGIDTTDAPISAASATKLDERFRAALAKSEEKSEEKESKPKVEKPPVKRVPKPDPNQAQYDQAVKAADEGEPLF